jgi:hypothetical protein
MTVWPTKFVSKGILSPRLKWLGYEADHSPPSSAEVKKEWSFTSTTLYTFMMCSVVCARNKFYLLNDDN